MITPSVFAKVRPWDSVLQKTEAEMVARNIMVILYRKGDSFQELTWDEYKEERVKDGNWSLSEKFYFEQCIPYCTSVENARRFSKSWEEAAAIEENKQKA